VISMVAAGLAGATIPIVLTSIGQDPARRIGTSRLPDRHNHEIRGFAAGVLRLVRHAAPDELHVDPCPGRFCRFAGNRPSRTTYRPYNVVAIIRGSDDRLKDEHITVAAHLDGAVGSRAVDGDAVYNSADDNASGSAAMTAWLMLFLVQSLLVPARRLRIHMKLGWGGVATALVAAGSGFMLAVVPEATEDPQGDDAPREPEHSGRRDCPDAGPGSCIRRSGRRLERVG